MPSLDSYELLLLAGLLGCCALCLYRIGRGPTAPDRMVAIDVLGTLLVGFVAIFTGLTARSYLLDVALVFALVSFIGSLALARYLTEGSTDE